MIYLWDRSNLKINIKPKSKHGSANQLIISDQSWNFGKKWTLLPLSSSRYLLEFQTVNNQVDKIQIEIFFPLLGSKGVSTVIVVTYFVLIPIYIINIYILIHMYNLIYKISNNVVEQRSITSPSLIHLSKIC